MLKTNNFRKRSLTKHHTMKTYWGVEVRLQALNLFNVQRWGAKRDIQI